jgi:hypothetical protein
VIAKEWTNIFHEMPAHRVTGRFQGPLSLIERAWGYLRAGNITATQRILKDVDATPFFRQEVEGLKEGVKLGSQELVAHGGA